jgi:leader peptidase (prepilin peptidase)/N-methyltransferase
MDYFYANSIFLICFSPIIGTIVAKLVIYLAKKDVSLILKPLKCNVCCNPLHLIEKIPLFSYILMKGRCKFCDNLRTPIYFFSELSSLLVLITILSTSKSLIFSQFILFYSMALFLIGLSIYDILTKRLPDMATLPFLLLGLSQSYWLHNIDFQDSVFGAVAGGLITALVATAYHKLRGNIGIGWGDVKLISAFGAWIGWQLLPLFILFSSVSGILFILLRLIALRRSNIREQIPFGPFLCMSGWIIWLQTLN